jgi:adenosylcobinamide-GDP ribazoletransferase
LTPLFGPTQPGPVSLWWFPTVGALIGLAVGGAWWLAARVWPPSVAAAVAVVSDAVFTGLLHWDGVGDAADGLLAPVDRAERLRIMAEPQIGAFGAAAVAVVMLCRWAAFSAIRADPLVSVALWTASRTWMATAAVRVPYARAGGGLASVFLEPDGRATAKGVPLAAAGLAASLLLGAAWRVVPGVSAVAAGTLTATALIGVAWRRLGGFTGDVLGAAGVIGETVGLVVAAARW